MTPARLAAIEERLREFEPELDAATRERMMRVVQPLTAKEKSHAAIAARRAWLNAERSPVYLWDQVVAEVLKVAGLQSLLPAETPAGASTHRPAGRSPHAIDNLPEAPDLEEWRQRAESSERRVMELAAQLDEERRRHGEPF